jgi:hypothetical protein
VLEAGRLWAVQNLSNQISRIRLALDLSSGEVEGVTTDDLFQAPTTAARFGSRLAVVNAKIDTGIPPQADQYEVIVSTGEREPSERRPGTHRVHTGSVTGERNGHQW